MGASIVDYLRNSDIDTVILAQPDRVIARAAFFARIRYRIGNARQKIYLRLFCNPRVHFSKRVTEDHEAQINFNFLRPYGDTVTPTREQIPALYHFDIPRNADIATRFAPYTFNLVLHTKSNGHGREWPVEYYTELARLLATQPGVHLWLTGSGNEGKWLREHGAELVSQPNVTDVCGQLTLGELTQLIHQADGFIASGTGPLHMSAAIGQRTLGLFPPTRPMHPGRWAALGTRAWNMCVESSCRDCEKMIVDTCDCMRQITPASVHALMQDWIREKAAEAANAGQ
jgi:ADP-heptose:LPS heptosyltransferase